MAAAAEGEVGGEWVLQDVSACLRGTGRPVDLLRRQVLG